MSESEDGPTPWDWVPACLAELRERLVDYWSTPISEPERTVSP